MDEITGRNTWTQGEIGFESISEYAESFQGVWHLDFKQLTAATCAGGCRFVTDGRSLLYRETYPASIALRGALGGDSICFVLTDDRGQSGRWDGADHTPNSIAKAVSGREFDVVLPGATVNLVVVIPIDVFRDEFERLAGRSGNKVFSDSGLFLRLNPAVLTMLATGWHEWTKTPRPRDNLTRRIIESLVRACDLSRPGEHGGGGSPMSLFRRAVRLLEGSAVAPTISDLALQLGVSLRSLELAFNACAGLPPVRYLHRYRLNRVHESLLKSGPSGTSVGILALEHGFLQLGRFSGDYRELFGELPSQTLRKPWRQSGNYLPEPR